MYTLLKKKKSSLTVDLKKWGKAYKIITKKPEVELK